jgi:hypothetical protein
MVAFEKWLVREYEKVLLCFIANSVTFPVKHNAHIKTK